MRVDDCAAHEFEAALFEIFGERIALGARRLILLRRARMALDGLAANETPNVLVESAELFLHVEEKLGVDDRALELQLVADKAFVLHHLRDVFACELRDFACVEVRKGLAIVVTLLEDRDPTQARLRAFENQEFKMRLVVVNGNAPFLVMIFRVEIVVGGNPVAALFHVGE